MFESIEKELSKIANVLEKLVEQPVKRQRKATVKKEEKKIEVVQESEEPEDSLGLGLGDEPAPTPTIVRTEEDVRVAAKGLIDTAVKAGDTQRKGYDAAAAIVEAYGESVATIPEEKRGEAINALQEKACGWEKK